MSTYLTDEELDKVIYQFTTDPDRELRAIARAAIAAYLRKHGEPVAHICIINTADAGPTKFFTAPSDPRGFPVFAAPPLTDQERQDAARLDWMIFHSAKVTHDRDGEYCRVEWVDDDWKHSTAPFGNAREAIDAAMSKESGHE